MDVAQESSMMDAVEDMDIDVVYEAAMAVSAGAKTCGSSESSVSSRTTLSTTPSSTCSFSAIYERGQSLCYQTSSQSLIPKCSSCGDILGHCDQRTERDPSMLEEGRSSSGHILVRPTISFWYRVPPFLKSSRSMCTLANKSDFMADSEVEAMQCDGEDRQPGQKRLPAVRPRARTPGIPKSMATASFRPNTSVATARLNNP